MDIVCGGPLVGSSRHRTESDGQRPAIGQPRRAEVTVVSARAPGLTPLDSARCGSLSSAAATSAPSTPPAWPSSATRWSASTSSRPRSPLWPRAGRRSTSPGCPSCSREALATGRLGFSTDAAAAAGAEVHFVCVGTPQKHGENAADLRYVYAAVEDLLPHLSAGRRRGRQVHRAGRHRRAAGRPARRGRARAPTLIWNPEFLREGHAVEDTLHPDRFVYGVARRRRRASGPPRGSTRSTRRRSATGTPKLVTDLATAQLVKVAANSFLATKISFINAMAELCEVAGADVTQLADAIGLDDRIGRKFLNAGRRLRRRLPAQGHPGLHGPGRRARRRPGADVPARGGRDQHAPPGPDGRPGPRGVRRLDRRPPDRRARAPRSSRTATTSATRRR